MFINDNFKEVCNERYECRDQDGRLSGKGDGEIWEIYDKDLDDYLEQSDEKLIKKAGKWSIILTLKFIIPAIKGVFGHFTFSTKGVKSSLPQIRDSFDIVLNQAGRVSNIPFDLIVQKVKSQKPGKKYLFPVVSLVPNISQQNMEIVSNYLNQGKSLNNIGLLTEEKILQLTEGNSKKEETEKDSKEGKSSKKIPRCFIPLHSFVFLPLPQSNGTPFDCCKKYLSNTRFSLNSNASTVFSLSIFSPLKNLFNNLSSLFQSKRKCIFAGIPILTSSMIPYSMSNFLALSCWYLDNPVSSCISLWLLNIHLSS